MNKESINRCIENSANKIRLQTAKRVILFIFTVAFALTSFSILGMIKRKTAVAAIANYDLIKKIDGKVIQVEMGIAASGDPSSSNYGGRNLILTDVGSVYVWGTTATPSSYTTNSNTSNVSSTNVLAKVNIPADDGKVVAVSVGAYTMFALTENGSVYAWGINFAGECGDGLYGFGTGGTINNSSQTLSVRTQSTPKKITALTNIVQVVAQQEGAMALDTNGDVWAWGRALPVRCFTASSPDAVQYMTQRTNQYCIPSPQKVITGENISKLIYNYIPGGYMLAINEDYSKIWGWGALSGAESTGLGTGTTLAAISEPVRCDKLEQANIREYKNSAYVDIDNNVFARVCGGTNWRYEKVAELPSDYIDWTIKEVASYSEVVNVVNTAYQTDDGCWHAKVPGGAQSFMFGFPLNAIYENFCEMNLLHTPDYPKTDKFGFKHSSYGFVRGFTPSMAACMIADDGSFHLVGKFISGNDTYNPKFQTIAGSMLFGTAANNWFEIFAYDRNNADALLPMGTIKSCTGNITFRFKTAGAKITNIRVINNSTQSVLNVVNSPAGVIPEDAALTDTELPPGIYRIEITNLDGETDIRELMINSNDGGHIIDAEFDFDIPSDGTYPGSLKFENFELGTSVTVQIAAGTATNYNGTVYYASPTSTKYTFVCTSPYGKKSTHTLTLYKNFMGDDAIEPDIVIDTAINTELVKTDKYTYEAYSAPQISWTNPNVIGVALDNIFKSTAFTVEEYGIHELAVVYFKNSIDKGELDHYKINLDYINETQPEIPVQAVNKTTLIALYNLLKDKYDPKFYTDSSYNIFKATGDTAKNIIDNDNATQDEIQSAYEQLVAGVVGLTLKPTIDDVMPSAPNKTSLQIVYDEVSAMQQNKYTAESYAKLTTIIFAADEILGDVSATQIQIDEVLKEIIEAVVALQPEDSGMPIVNLPNKTALQILLDKFFMIQGDNYSTESYANFSGKLSAAESILENDSSTQIKIDVAFGDLVNAIAELEFIVSGTDKTVLATIINDAQNIADTKGGEIGLTTTSYELLMEAIRVAQQILSSGDATTDEIQYACKSLITAVGNLTPQAEAPTSSDPLPLTVGVICIAIALIVAGGTIAAIRRKDTKKTTNILPK